MKEQTATNSITAWVIAGFLFVWLLGSIASCASGVNHGEANAAYKRLKDLGFSDKQIYEMGK